MYTIHALVGKRMLLGDSVHYIVTSIYVAYGNLNSYTNLHYLLIGY